MLVLFLSLGVVGGCGSDDPEAKAPADQAVEIPVPYDMGEPVYEGITRKSFHLTMRDGVKIAVDVYLPEDLKPGTKLPTLMWQTRYWRSMKIRTGFKWLADKPQKIIQDFVPRGYAYVSVDARGSGASYGVRPMPWSPDEIKDGAEVVDWIVAQPWSNGKVGSEGISYNGSTADFLATNQHPAVKAVAPRFSLYDPFSDIGFPGGIQHNWFTRGWHDYNSHLDGNDLPDTLKERIGFLGRMMVEGVRPVDGDDDGKLLAAALRDHEANWNVHAFANQTDFIDERTDEGLSTMDFSPYMLQEKVNNSDTVIYSFSGWFDGGYPQASVKRFRTLKNPRNKLILGPWTHGGQFTSSPWNSGKTRFSQHAELMKFFDYYLKDEDTGITREPRVHYYTMGEEKWKSSDTWPPEADTRVFHLRENAGLEEAAPKKAESFDEYKVDQTHGTGKYARWNTLLNAGLMAKYPDRAEQDRKLLVYDSDPLTTEIEVTGHPVVRLWVSSTADDGAFFVYLEDVGPDGAVRYVTEGQLRALHRKISQEADPTHAIGPFHSFKKEDAEKLRPGEPAELAFALQPVSYLFKKGHRIRVAVGGADKDHFVMIPLEPPTIKVYHQKDLASRIELPVIEK